MITRTAPLWQRQLAEGVTSVDELLRLLALPPSVLGASVEAQAAARDFPLRVPRAFIARMDPGDPNDPLLLQVLPRDREMAVVPGFTGDPLGEVANAPVRPTPGVLHKYHGRVLLVVTGACAIHCRYCFRRHFPYDTLRPERSDWDPAVHYVAADPTIREVILSGGDPLAASDQRLATLVEALAAIPHLDRLRIHTRLPIVLPERVDEAFLAWITAPSVARLQRVVVLHANHPAEIDDGVRAACRRLRQAGVTLLNQTVLLAGVNDEAATLAALSDALFATGVLPYYLHLLDPVAGAAHFAVTEDRARRLYRDLLARCPGYLVPRLVREVEGAAAKVPYGLL